MPYPILRQHEVQDNGEQEDYCHTVICKNGAYNLGKMLNIPVADVNPRPTLSERLTMTMLR